MSQRVGYAWRRLRRRWRDTLLIVGLLGAGIGAASAMVAVLRAVVLDPPPVRAVERLAEFRMELVTDRLHGVPIPAATLRAFRISSRSLAGVAGYEFHGADDWAMVDATRGLSIPGTRVTGDFFAVLGARAVLGRTLEPADDEIGAEPAMVISNRLWHRAFGGDPAAVGRTIRNPLYDVTYRIVGVMPEGFGYPSGVDAWVPTATFFPPSLGADPRDVNLYLVGRRAPPFSLTQAQAELTTFLRATLPPAWAKTARATAEPLAGVLEGSAPSVVWTLTAAVALFLLIVCANVSSLLVMRLSARRTELAIRVAIGADRGDLVGQLMIEYALTATLGGVAGVAVAAGSIAWVRHLAIAPLPRIDAVHLDGAALLAAGLLTAASAVLFGLIPAVVTSRIAGRPSLRDAIAPATRWREALVVAQLAITVMVLCVGAVLVRSLRRLERADVGFPARDVVVTQVSLPLSRFGPRLSHLYQVIDDLEQRLRALPGARGASVTALAPFTPTTGFFAVTTDADRPAAPGNGLRANTEYVGDGYVGALGLPLVAGRDLTPADREGAPRVAVVSDALARALWGGGDAIGRRIRLGDDSAITVVGVARDARYRDIRTASPTVYLPYRQLFGMVPFYFLTRMGGATVTASAMRHQLAAVDRDLALVRLGRMTTWLDGPLALPRFDALLVALFGGVALAVAAAGFYGVLSMFVTLRSRELGIRMAIGATRANVVRFVLGRGVRLIVPGVSLGAVAFVALAPRLSSQLFEIQATDARSLVAGTVLVAGAGLAACWVPAWRAARVDPASALKRAD